MAVYARENGQGMAFEVPRALAAGGTAVALAAPEAAAEPAPAESAGPAGAARLRAVEGPRPVSAPGEPTPAATPQRVPARADDLSATTEQPAPPPAGGERPKLTRIK
jgi:stringent starvation protein B